MSHAHIVQVYELGREGDLDFIVMEFIEGQPLIDLLRGRPLPPDSVADWGLQVADGLARAHRKGLIHRDLKPANILITPEGEVKIVDFGLAVLFERRDSTVASVASMLTETLPEQTRTRIAGTLPYMSPEQVRGEKLDARSDIFSFGTVLYEMTTGRRPFQGAKAADIVQEILKNEPRPVRELAPMVPLDLHRIIDKSLVKRREDRYQIIDDVAVDLRHLRKNLESGSSPSYRDPVVVPPRRRWWIPVLALVLTMALASVLWLALGRDQIGPRDSPTALDRSTQRPNWILVAEFEGPREDSTLVVAVRELVIAGLDQSVIVTPITTAQLRRGLQLALKPPGTIVRGEVARELAYRAGARTYLEGRVDRLQPARSIVLRVVDSESRYALITVRGVAESEDACIATVDRLCRELRKELGESRSSVQNTLDAREAITPSFEAYQLLVKAGHMQLEQNWTSSNRLLDLALAYDPEFANAWSLRAANFLNLGFPDSALIALEQASGLAGRLTEEGRFRVEALRALVQNDWLGALRFAEMAGARFLNNRAIILRRLGRHEEALECFSRASEFYSPFGPTPLILSNQIEHLINLGHYAEARDLAKKLRSDRPKLLLSLATRDWAAAESLATDWATSADPYTRCSSQMTLASLRMLRGEVRAGMLILGGILPAHRRDFNDRGCFMLLHAQLLCGPSVSSAWPLACSDTTAAGLLMSGLDSAVRGNISGARQMLGGFRDQPANKFFSNDADFLEALICSRENDWGTVIRLLEPMRTSGQPQVGTLPVRWLVAEAHERLGNPGKAAEAYELVLAPIKLSIWDAMEIQHQYALFLPFAHHRLVLLHSKMGRVEDARRHWEIFEQTFTNPDPELLPMLEEARQALAMAQASP